MKKVELFKSEHNGLKGYKDATTLFFVRKDPYGTWKLFKAKQYNSESVNKCYAWGYEIVNENWRFKTLKDVKMQIEDIIENGVWFDKYQQELKNNYYYGE